jgi:hypothetical protein
LHHGVIVCISIIGPSTDTNDCAIFLIMKLQEQLHYTDHLPR